MLIPPTVSAIKRDAITAVRSARRIIRLIQTPLIPSTSSMPSTNSPATSNASAITTEARGREREQRGLRNGVERQREQRADRRHGPGSAHGEEAPEQPRLEPGRRDDGIRTRDQYCAQVHEREAEQEHDRHRRAR